MMIRCPVCGKYDFEEDFELCPICNWQHDRVQESDSDFWGGANELSLNDYREKWLMHETLINSKSDRFMVTPA